VSLRRYLPSAIAVAVMIAPPAFAADQPILPPLATKVALAQAASYNWAGWYIGGNIGFGWGISSNPSVSFVDPGGVVGFGPYFADGGNAIPNLNPRGLIGGGQIGFNWTPTPNWVAGLVADFQGSGTRDAMTNTVTPPLGFLTSNQFSNEQIDWFGTLRAKLGFAQNHWLLYATGGLAYGSIASSGSFVLPGVMNFTGSDSTTNLGWAAGAGLNYGLTSNWIVGVEYLYVDLGKVSYTESQPAIAPGASLTINNRAAVHIARLSLDYKF
jgi:outer membrane immunogenic protein